MDYEKELYELCEKIKEEISEANEKIKKAGGKLSAGDVDYIDKLTHSLKSIKAVMAMMEDEEDDYSGRMSYARGGRGGLYRGGSYRGSSYDDGMMTGGEGGSYARDGRGRGSNARRDSMGRYSSRMDGYSRHGDVVESLREVMEEAPDDRTRMEIQRLIEKMEQR